MSLKQVIKDLEASQKAHFSDSPMRTDNAMIHLRNAVWELVNYLSSKQTITEVE